MARQRLNGDISVPTASAADTFDDIPQARKQAIREEVMDDYYARLQAVKKRGGCDDHYPARNVSP